MNQSDKKSPIGESWSSYRELHYTSEERNENDFMAGLTDEIIIATYPTY